MVPIKSQLPSYCYLNKRYFYSRSMLKSSSDPFGWRFSFCTEEESKHCRPLEGNYHFIHLQTLPIYRTKGAVSVWSTAIWDFDTGRDNRPPSSARDTAFFFLNNRVHPCSLVLPWLFSKFNYTCLNFIFAARMNRTSCCPHSAAIRPRRCSLTHTHARTQNLLSLACQTHT